MAAFSAWSGGESITSEVIGGRTASAYIGGVKAEPARPGRGGRDLDPSPDFLGTPYDITRHELRIECFFAADRATEEALRRLA